VVRTPNPDADPGRVAAGKIHYARRKGLTAEGLERLRTAALANQPWLRSTGPKTAAGKARSAANGRAPQKGEKSVRERRAELAGLTALARAMAATGNGLGGRSSGQGIEGG
jgi:hypothetical protein